MAIEAQMAKWMNDIDEEYRKKYGRKTARSAGPEFDAAGGSLALTTPARAVTRDFERDGGATEPALRVLAGDCHQVLRELATESVQCCVTSPPYWGLRDYGHGEQLGREETLQEYVSNMVEVFAEVWRVLKPDGTLWLNLGDSYANDDKWGGRTGGKHAGALHGSSVGRAKRNSGLKPKDLAGIPWRVALALQDAGWWLRQDIIWAKPNVMPESVRDRCTKSHEYIFLLTKAASYYFDADAIAEPTTCARMRGPAEHPDTKSTNGNGGLSRRPVAETRNKRSVWTVPTAPYPNAHFAVYPAALITPCILAGTKPGDVVLDPFAGSGTTGATALALSRKAVLIELNPDYAKLIKQRTTTTMGLAL